MLNWYVRKMREQSITQQETFYELNRLEQEQSGAEGSTFGIKLALQDRETHKHISGCQIVSISKVSHARKGMFQCRN